MSGWTGRCLQLRGASQRGAGTRLWGTPDTVRAARCGKGCKSCALACFARGAALLPPKAGLRLTSRSRTAESLVRARSDEVTMKLCGFDVGLDRPLFVIAGSAAARSRD